MMYSEFVDKVNEYRNMWGNKYAAPLADYYGVVIEPTYLYHPAQFNKDEIATLYCIGGPALMRELYDSCTEVRELEDEISRLEIELNTTRNDLARIKEAYNRKR